MRKLLVVLVLGASATGPVLAESDTLRAAVRVSTHIAGQVTSLHVCAGADPSNAVAYRSAASEYQKNSDIAAANDAAQKILAEDARQAGRDAKQAVLAQQNAEAALAASLHDAAAADKARFVAECRDELRDFDNRSGSFVPLDELFPYEMKLLLAASAAQ